MYNLFQNIIKSGKRRQVKTACRTKILSLKHHVNRTIDRNIISWLHSGSLIHTDLKALALFLSLSYYVYHGEGQGEYLLALEVWNSEKHLHDRVEVAAVAQIFHASQARAKQRLQGGPRLLDHLPLPHALVHSNLQLRHCPLSLTSDKRLKV